MAYSVDLTTAFDLVLMDTFDEIVGPHLSEGLRYAVLDFLSRHKFTVNVGQSSSSMNLLPVGCVQGSTLGPRLFTLYMSGLADIIRADKYVS